MDEQTETGASPSAALEPLATSPAHRAEKRADITLHQLRIFWAVAHSDTLTRAAKQLGLAQPSLSQQLSRLETTLGLRLFDRRSNQMILTEAGTFLLPRAEHVLRGMRELEDGLSRFAEGGRTTVRIAGINSVLRVLLPEAIQRMQHLFPEVDFDIQEHAPADILEMLYARRANIGLIAANTVAEASLGFLQVPLLDDPHVLVVPDWLDLDAVADPARDLPDDQRSVLNQSIQFIFGTQHVKRVEDWFNEVLPDHRVAAQCRSFEIAVGLVRAGVGVCLAPVLSTLTATTPLDGLRLYRVDVAPRRLVALVPSQYRRVEPYQSLLDTLQDLGRGFVIPQALPTPPFLRGHNGHSLLR